MATAGESDVAGAVGNAGMLPFQVQFIKNLIDESLDEFRYVQKQLTSQLFIADHINLPLTVEDY